VPFAPGNSAANIDHGGWDAIVADRTISGSQFSWVSVPGPAFKNQ